jgi:hypothetical protein
LPRVRVTAPRTPGRRPLPAGLGSGDPSAVYVRSLIRAQLRAALVAAGTFGLLLAVTAAVLALAPEARAATVAGIPIVWIVLGAAVYPVVLVVAILFVRAVGRNEEHYRSLAADDQPGADA